MDFKDLTCFAAIVEEGTISGAAQRLHIAQPALSLRLKALGLTSYVLFVVFLLLTAIFLKLQVGDDDAHGHTSKNEEKELPVPDSPPPGKAS